MGDTHYEESALNVGKGICSRIKQNTKLNYTIPSQSAKGAQKIEKKILTDKIQCRRQLQPATKRPNQSPSLPLQDPNTGRKRKNT